MVKLVIITTATMQVENMGIKKTIIFLFSFERFTSIKIGITKKFKKNKIKN